MNYSPAMLLVAAKDIILETLFERMTTMNDTEFISDHIKLKDIHRAIMCLAYDGFITYSIQEPLGKDKSFFNINITPKGVYYVSENLRNKDFLESFFKVFDNKGETK